MKKFEVDHGKEFDFGKPSDEYAKYRDIYPQQLFDKLYALGIGKNGSDWLDLGTGTGVVPRGMYMHGAKIIGTDISENQIAAAKQLSAGIDNITYKVCPAESTGFADNSFDAITAVQCFWYFDPEKIVPEIRRMIKPGGVFAKVYMGWIKEDEIAAKSKNLVKELNPDWTSAAPAVKDLVTHYFDNPIMDTFFADLPFTRESWHGRMLACRGVQGSMNNDVLQKFEDEHMKMMQNLPEIFTVRHKIFITAYKL